MTERAFRPRVAISVGDPNGIGPEVALRCVADPDLRRRLRPILVGAPAVLDAHMAVMGLDLPLARVDDVGDWDAENDVAIFDPESDFVEDGPIVEFGSVSRSGGRRSMAAVDSAVQLCLDGAVDAMVTAPISKEAISLAGYPDPGHTEFIARRTGAAAHTMMLVAGNLRVGLVTGHIPILEVPGRITADAIREKIRIMHASLVRDFGIPEPRIAVLGLNPHAGDGGVLGHEEVEVITPTLAALQNEGFRVSGPFPADGLFASGAGRRFDAVLAMYHDQGLGPFKALAFDTGVNFTAGLPIVRTSPDHGTAFDIAGRGMARADSMRAALLVAVDIVGRRQEVEV